MAAEKNGEGVDGEGVAAEVGHPGEEPEPWRCPALAEHGGEEEEELEEEAAEDEGVQLPPLPPPLPLRETHGDCLGSLAAPPPSQITITIGFSYLNKSAIGFDRPIIRSFT